MQDSQAGPVVLITGASSGIGRATALAYAGRKARLTLLARHAESLEAAATEVRAAGAASVETVVADVLDQPALVKAFEELERREGRLDVVVHSATVMAYGSVEDLPAEVFDRVVETAVSGSANIARALLPVFRRQQRGALVYVSSLLASIAAPTMGAYVAAKWGQLGLIRTLQIETRDVPGISISAVSPGGVDTPIYYQAANVTGWEGRPPPPVYKPERVAAQIVRAAEHPRRLTQAGIANPVIILGFRLLPFAYDRMVGPLLRTFGVSRRPVSDTEGNVFDPKPAGDETRGRWRAV